MLITILLLGISSLMVLLFGSHLGKKLAACFVIGTMGLNTLGNFYILNKVLFQGQIIKIEYLWLDLSVFTLKFNFLFDVLSTLLLVLISVITLLVMIYSFGYLNEDPSIIRFLGYLSFFAFTMIFMVTAGNYVQLFVGWEGVGLASYLLISFWTTRTEANISGMKAVTINRIGDVFFLFALGLIWLLYKTFDFSLIQGLNSKVIEAQEIVILGGVEIYLVSLLTFSIIIAAFAKSAQLFLHTWLPDAMEGPTPVSSLLHSATMVTAGVFLLIRSSYVLYLPLHLTLFIVIVGVLTSIISGLIAVTQNDLKKIIAYSTCSQLGFMVFTCGLGYYNFALFHLITHAFFKCLLFLCSGSVIHAVNDEQDIRRMGHLATFMPLTAICTIIGNLALTGFPFLAGFFSKDAILEIAYTSSIFGHVVYILGVFAACLTVIYSFRAIYFVLYHTSTSIFKPAINTISDASLFLGIPMIILATLSIISGYFLSPYFTNMPGQFFWSPVIAPNIMGISAEHEYLSSFIKLLPTFAVLFSFVFIFGLILTSVIYFWPMKLKNLYYLLNNKFYFDSIYNYFLLGLVMGFGYVAYVLIDRGILEHFGATGFSRIFTKSVKNLRRFITASITVYFVIALGGLFITIMILGALDFFVKIRDLGVKAFPNEDRPGILGIVPDAVSRQLDLSGLYSVTTWVRETNYMTFVVIGICVASTIVSGVLIYKIKSGIDAKYLFYRPQPPVDPSIGLIENAEELPLGHVGYNLLAEDGIPPDQIPTHVTVMCNVNKTNLADVFADVVVALKEIESIGINYEEDEIWEIADLVANGIERVPVTWETFQYHELTEIALDAAPEYPSFIWVGIAGMIALTCAAALYLKYTYKGYIDDKIKTTTTEIVNHAINDEKILLQKEQEIRLAQDSSFMNWVSAIQDLAPWFEKYHGLIWTTIFMCYVMFMLWFLIKVKYKMNEFYEKNIIIDESEKTELKRKLNLHLVNLETLRSPDRGWFQKFKLRNNSNPVPHVFNIPMPPEPPTPPDPNIALLNRAAEDVKKHATKPE